MNATKFMSTTTFWKFVSYSLFLKSPYNEPRYSFTMKLLRLVYFAHITWVFFLSAYVCGAKLCAHHPRITCNLLAIGSTKVDIFLDSIVSFSSHETDIFVIVLTCVNQ